VQAVDHRQAARRDDSAAKQNLLQFMSQCPEKLDADPDKPSEKKPSRGDRLANDLSSPLVLPFPSTREKPTLKK
jgi:hypothetical protein